MTEPRGGTELLKAFLSNHPSIHHIRVNFAAYDNYRYSKGISTRRALAWEGGVSVPGPITFGQTRYTQLLQAAIDDHETSRWIPDWSTVRVSAGNACVADVSVWLESPNCLRDDGDALASCPRVILQRLERRAQQQSIDIKVGWEIEFLLLPSQDAAAPVPTPPASFSTIGMSDPSFKIVYDAVEHLEANGVNIWTYHAESGHGGGGFEITLSPAGPLESADNLLYSMTVIREVAQRHGYFATMHPKRFESGAGTGQHIHMSISRPELANHFLAGVMARLRQTTAFLLGGYDSYSTGRRAAYGGGLIYHTPDKIPPVRDCGEAHWEFRMPDSLTIPHLQLAGLISSGLEGVEKKLKAPIARKVEEMMGMSTAQAKTAGIDVIPTTLAEAIDALEEDAAWWKAQLGSTCFDGYITNSRAEIAQSANMSYAQRTMLALNHV